MTMIWALTHLARAISEIAGYLAYDHPVGTVLECSI